MLKLGWWLLAQANHNSQHTKLTKSVEQSWIICLVSQTEARARGLCGKIEAIAATVFCVCVYVSIWILFLAKLFVLDFDSEPTHAIELWTKYRRREKKKEDFDWLRKPHLWKVLKQILILLLLQTYFSQSLIQFFNLFRLFRFQFFVVTFSHEYYSVAFSFSWFLFILFSISVSLKYFIRD